MTAYTIGKMFLHPTLTKIAQDGENPNYTSIKQLKDELISNAVDVPSDLGDGLNGHLFLVISENGYSKATIQLNHRRLVNLPNQFPSLRVLVQGLRQLIMIISRKNSVNTQRPISNTSSIIILQDAW